MTRSLQALVLLLAFLVQAVVASPEPPLTSSPGSLAASVAPCRCCQCGGMACCAPASDSAPAVPRRATPARSIATEELLNPPAPLSPVFALPFVGHLPPMPRPSALRMGPSASAPSFLSGGGLLI